MGSSFSVKNDTDVPLYFKSTCHQGAMIGVGLGMAILTAIPSGGTSLGIAAATTAGAAATASAVGIATANISENVRSTLKDKGYMEIKPGRTFKFRGTLSLVQTCHVSTGAPSPDSITNCILACAAEGALAGGGQWLKFSKKGKEMSKSATELAKANKVLAGAGGSAYVTKTTADIVKACQQDQTFTAWTGSTKDSNRVYSLSKEAPKVYAAALQLAAMDRASRVEKIARPKFSSDPIHAWLLCKSDGGTHRLWRADLQYENNLYAYPSTTKMVQDGTGGCWLLCKSSDPKKSLWTLWHADENGEKSYYDYPSTSKMVSDGMGGCWVLCKTTGSDQWKLWHVDTEKEKSCYTYPAATKMVSDAKGGAWLLCKGTDPKQTNWNLWHATTAGEKKLYKYPSGSTMVTDGQGGVWMLCKDTSVKDMWKLWHATTAGEKGYYTYPSGAKMVTDGRGGCYVLCKTKGKPQWQLWHANTDGEKQYYSYPESTKMVTDARGGCWLLCKGTDKKQTNWNLWHANRKGEKQYYKYPSATTLAACSLEEEESVPSK